MTAKSRSGKEEGAGPHGGRDVALSAKEKSLPAAEEILTAGEVADLLRVHPSTIYKLLRQGELPAFRIGSNWRFLRASIDEWLMTQSHS